MCDPPAAVPRQISNHFRPAQRMANDDGILYIDSIKDRADIVGECIEIVTVAGVIRTPMTTPIERNATPTALGKAN
jgi:hypothetical protein